jgi:ferritin-like metal-binding protein YciE
MKMKTLHDLYVEELKDLYSAENQIIKALPRMVKAASSSELQEAFEKHLEETKEHAQRLEQIFKKMGINSKGKKCKGMKGLLEEGKDMLKGKAEPAVKDAGIIAAAQRVEHYEIAGYGCARTYAGIIGDQEAAELLQQTLEEEGAADKKLTEVAENTINSEAAMSAEAT